MWNPFRSVKLQAVVPETSVKSAVGPEITDPQYVAEVERFKLRSLLARTQISMIHETLATKALYQYRGVNSCPD